MNGSQGEAERNALIHTIGNLTLLAGKLNAKVSNGPWLGSSGKRQALVSYDVLLLNSRLVDSAMDQWTESAIRSRSDLLIDAITDIWPVPPGHRSGFAKEKVRPKHHVDLMDLLSAGRLMAGTPLVPRSKKLRDRVATLLPDGRIDLDGTVYSRPSEAAKAITGKSTNGWWFLLVDPQSKRSLKDVRLEYLESLSGEGDEDGEDEDEVDDD